jgi:cell filamentation protein
MTKGGSRFQFTRYIETGMADVHRRLTAQEMLKGLSREAFAEAAGQIIGDVNFVHPFREGNGRTQLLYLSQLAQAAGHPLDLTQLTGPAWIAASRDAMDGRYAPMAREIAGAII